MTLIELPPDLVRECRVNIMAEVRQSNPVAAKEAYATYVRVISNPFVILQGRIVRGGTMLQYLLNAVLIARRVLLPLTAFLLLLAIFWSTLRYFFWSIAAVATWWFLSKFQFWLNIELAARYKALMAHMTGNVFGTEALVNAIRDAVHAIQTPRFFETERGYQGELLAEIRMRLKRLPEIPEWDVDVVVEQEAQKRTTAHGLKLRPDLIIHEPFDNKRHSTRREGNYICLELKLRASEAQASEAYRNLSQLMSALNYPLGIFINIDSSQTYISLAPTNSGRFFAFAVKLEDGEVKVYEEHT